MNVFEKYSIEEINKRTKISPISLRYIKNKEFSKIPRVKFIGFIRIIENEFKVDLSDLIKEYEEATKHLKKDNNEITFEKNKKNSNLLTLLFAISLIIIGGYYLYKNINQNKSFIDQNLTKEETKNNLIKIPINNTDKIEQNQTLIKEIEENVTEDNITKEKNITQSFVIENNITTQIKSIKIIPKEKVWFRAINLDTNKTVEYLTSLPKELNGSNWYIKFGHGFITIHYGDETITPNTKKIVRILLKDGKYEFLKKPNRYEK